MIDWYDESFSKTQIQARYPRTTTRGRMGYHDDSFCYSTIDGAANGGVEQGWFFLPRLQQMEEQTAWKTAMIGGETFPERQPQVFRDDYPARTEMHQDFGECTAAVHATYMIHHDAFANGGYTGPVLARALQAHDQLGYNFCITRIALSSSSNDPTVDVSITLQQMGVAPFYYDLSLLLCCDGVLEEPMRVDGIESRLVEPNESATITELRGVPIACFGAKNVEFRLTSSYLYDHRPIRFAQGDDGRAQYILPPPPIVSSDDSNVCKASTISGTS